MSNVLVLYSTEPEKLLEFFTAMGLTFVEEKHGTGPLHHASEINGKVLEIYKTAGGMHIRFMKDKA
jgi:hypothetical protein